MEEGGRVSGMNSCFVPLLPLSTTEWDLHSAICVRGDRTGVIQLGERKRTPLPVKLTTTSVRGLLRDMRRGQPVRSTDRLVSYFLSRSIGLDTKIGTNYGSR